MKEAGRPCLHFENKGTRIGSRNLGRNVPSHVLTRVQAKWNHKVKTFLPCKNYICSTQIKMRGLEDTVYTTVSTSLRLSPPQRLPLGIPIKISIIDNNRKRAGNDGKRETAGASLLSPPLPSCPARSLFLSPQPAHNPNASPQYKEASAD